VPRFAKWGGGVGRVPVFICVRGWKRILFVRSEEEEGRSLLHGAQEDACLLPSPPGRGGGGVCEVDGLATWAFVNNKKKN
jgi:hypothetical protein